MKMHILKRILPILLLCVGAYGQTRQDVYISNKIIALYKSYMSAFYYEDKENIYPLIENFFTPEMWKKRSRLICATDCDPLTRSQDISGYAIKTVDCKHLDGDWYEVSLCFMENAPLTYIPIKVIEDTLGDVRVSYVTPIWGGRIYGDEMLNIALATVIDNKDAKTFVETFYRRYACLYATMCPTLDSDLDIMVRSYCVNRLADYIGKKKDEESQDMDSCYDPVIGYGDFDALFYGSLKVEPMGKNVFSVSYDGVKLIVTTVCKKGKYKIKAISCQE